MTPDRPQAATGRSPSGQLVLNVVANYGYYVVGMGVMFILTPFLKDHLGKEVCGEWYYLVGLTIYFSLADAGFNAATVKFVAQHLARRDWDAAGRTMAASLGFFLALALLFVLLAIGTLVVPGLLVLPGFITHFLRFIDESTGLTVLAIILLNWSLEFAFAPFNAALFGAQRYDLARAAAILARLVRFAAVLLLLGLGYGVIALAAVTASEALVRGAIQWWLVRSRVPRLPVRLTGAERSIYREFFQFSAWILVSSLAYKLLMVTDNVLVQITRGEKAEVVVYNATMSSIIAMEQVLWALAQVLVPFAAAGAALADREAVRETVLRGARFTLLIALPMITYLCLAGHGFYGAWMFNPNNPEDFSVADVAEAQQLLWILAPAFLALFLQQPAIAAFVGTGNVRVPALVNLGQGTAKIVLSLVLVQRFGLVGIALGTVIPLVVTNLLVIPFLARRILDVRPVETLRESVWPGCLTLVLAGPLAWGWLELTRATDPATWRLRYQIPIALGVLAIYAAVAWFVGLKRDDRDWVRVRLPWRRRSPRRPDRSPTRP